MVANIKILQVKTKFILKEGQSLRFIIKKTFPKNENL